jgi:hypothetical protein
MNNRHLTDDRLVEIGLTDTPSANEQQHFGSCSACEARRAGIAHMLDEMSQAATEDADAAFPADHLAQQQRRILERIDLEPRPARVIAFPTSHPHDTAVSRIRPASRWIAAAAVAGLVVGLVAGRFGHDTSRGVLTAAAEPRSATTASAFRAATVVTISDDELLGQIEMAVDGRGGASLRPLDDLTPRAWEVTR